MEPARAKRAYTRRTPPSAMPDAITSPDEMTPVPNDPLDEYLETSGTEALPAPQRAPMRPSMRADDPRARAAARAAAVRANIGDMDEGTDEFAAPTPPDGWAYEWKTRTVLGAEDPAYQVQLARKGWEPVPASRHPEMMPVGAKDVNIERKGQVLMERPKELVDEARSIELRRARNQVRAKEQQLRDAPDGQFGRDHPQARPRINKQYEAMPIPADTE